MLWARIVGAVAWIKGSSGFLGKALLALLVVLSMLYSQSAHSTVSGQSLPTNATATMAYQGKLLDANGVPVNGPTDMVFRIYDAPSGGNLLWVESWTGTNAVQVNDGLFHVMIGSLNPTLSSLSTTNVSLLYLGLTAGTDPEMSPRLQMGSAINAIRSESLLPGSNVHVASLTTAGSVGVGTQQPMEKLQVAGNIKADTFIGYGVVPVGSVIAWHKSLPGTPALPDGWVECNGQVIADPQSVYNGQTAPDLNNRGLFIRGSTVSGTYQADQLQSHTHKDAGHADSSHDTDHNNTPANVDYSAYEYGYYRVANTGVGYAQLGEPVASSGGTVRYGTETRPANMSMIWVMRIK